MVAFVLNLTLPPWRRASLRHRFTALRVIPVQRFSRRHVEFPSSHPFNSRYAAPKLFPQLLEYYSLSFFRNPFGIAVAPVTAGDTFTAGGQ
jgi:hypothetical protein